MGQFEPGGFAVGSDMHRRVGRIGRLGRVGRPPRRAPFGRIGRAWSVPGVDTHPEWTRVVVGVVGATGFAVATIMLVPEHALGVEVLPDSWDAFLDLGLLFAIGALLIRRPATTLHQLGPTFTRGLLLGLVVAASIGAAAALARLWVHGGATVVLAALGILGLSILPLRAFVGGRADTVLLGGRDAPYRVLSALGRRVESAGSPDDVLDDVVRTVADALELPYVAIELELGDVPTRVTSVGHPSATTLRFPLVHQGRRHGRLVVGTPDARRLTAADRRLLHDLGAQVGSAAHAAQLVHELRTANRRMIAARADERRRLRRDLHDGLGPLLAGIGLTTQAARNRVGTDDASAIALLEHVAADSRHATVEVRRLLENLHPVLLDRLGLEGALRRKLEGLPGGPVTEIVVSGDLGDLPADIELAAYRIALEAHTNVVRHADARRCRIEIVRDGDLHVSVRDDGRGIAEETPPGVGLGSMAERAAELGGSCRVRTRRPRGTIVEASLPLDEL